MSRGIAHRLLLGLVGSTAVLAALCCLPARAQDSPYASGAHSSYTEPFGKGLYLPSEAKATFQGFLKPDEVPTAAYCGHCHAASHAQWRQSAHANAFRAPWYRKNVDLLAETKGIAYTRHCEGCHNPAALFTGAVDLGSTVKRPHDEDGVTCMVCHSIEKVDSTRGIGSYVMDTPAVMVDAQGKRMPGLPSDAEILAHVDRHREAVMQPVLHQPEFCGSCHKAAIPRSVNGYKWLRTFSTYDEWQQSGWSGETPLTFYPKAAQTTCQNCHMTRELTALPDPAARRGGIVSHRTLGANTAIPVQYGFDEQATRVVEFLTSNKLSADLFALTIERPGPSLVPASLPLAKTASAGQLVAPLGRVAFTVAPGDWVRADLLVRNNGIGHSLIPELRDIYESWVEFTATDDAGHVIYQSGALDARHRIDPQARAYSLRPIGHDGSSLDRHEIWAAYIKAYDATVLPGRSDVVRYRFQIPVGARGVTMQARVRYRRLRREFQEWVFSENSSAPERFPIVDLASARFHFNVGDNSPAAAPASADDAAHAVSPALSADALRWNNYGIGMLERQAFAEATAAFREVVRLAPAYEPGIVNIAVAEYSRGRYKEAQALLYSALLKQPGDDRARYYQGLCLRWQNRYPEAIAVLQPVAKRWPRFRQVHNELGYMLMTEKQYKAARDEFDLVLALDPDDPLAHRWLGPTLEALGDHAGALQEAKLAADTGIDTAAGWTAQRFWREHPDLAREAMPAHTHSAGNKHDDADVQQVLNLQNPPSYIWVEHF